MRREFHPFLLDHMRKNPRIHVISADLGFKMFDAIRDEFPSRFHNVAAAEQEMMCVAIGLAEEGLLSVTYTISSFYWRAAEFIRNYVDHEKVVVKMIGGGRNLDYAHDGFTHYCGDDKNLFGCFPNIKCYWPETIEELPAITHDWLYNDKPSYLNLRR